ncbi:class III extradiol dioxygenase subunit B-like domain-containing protein [Nocardia goodfellowii]
MFSLAALVPSPPILVPELGGAVARTAADPVAPLRAAALEAVRALDAAGEWVVVGIGDSTRRTLEPDHGTGTFRGFGADVRVALSGPALRGAGDQDATVPWPLSALIAGWLRGQAAPDTRVSVYFADADDPSAECVRLGTALRASFGASRTAVGALVVADGSCKLTTKSPGYLHPRAAGVQAELDRALATGDVASVLALDPELCAEVGISGRAAYQVLAGLFAEDGIAPKAETLYRGAPFGVGYHVGLWRPGGSA